MVFTTQVYRDVALLLMLVLGYLSSTAFSSTVALPSWHHITSKVELHTGSYAVPGTANLSVSALVLDSLTDDFELA